MAKKNQKKRPRIPNPSEAVHHTRIRVIGVGGGGGSIVSEIAPLIKRADFVVANTDSQALKEASKKVRVLQFGQNLTQGLGCGMDPKIGQKAARDAKQKISNLFKNADLVLIVSCLGGGTGSGATPEFAKIAREMGVMTMGIFTLPFKFEGAKRAQIARLSLEKLTPSFNAFSVIPNENIFRIIGKETPVAEAFSAVNKHLAENLRGLIEMVYCPGVVNIDFADLKTILEGKGKVAYLNCAFGRGGNRAEDSLKELLKSPLNEYSIAGADRILFNITASKELAMQEVGLISQGIFDFNRRAKIIFGVSQDNSYKDTLRIALLAVGCGKEPVAKKEKKKVKVKKSAPAPKPKKPVIKKRKKIKIKVIKVIKKKPVKKAKKEPATEVQQKIPPRKSGLDLQKDTEKTEEEFIQQEKKWDIPAFLRRQENR